MKFSDGLSKNQRPTSTSRRLPSNIVPYETGLYAFLNLDNELFLEQDVLLDVIAWVHKALDE